MKIYAVIIDNPITEEVKVRSVFSHKESAMKAFKELEKVFTNYKEPLGLSLSVDECYPNKDNEFIPMKTLITCPL